MKQKVLLALYLTPDTMRSMTNTGSTSTVVSITDRLHNIWEELDTLRNELGACIDASNARDFIPDENMTEWHPISVNRDQRWDYMDNAHDTLGTALTAIARAQDLSIKVDKE